MPWEADLDRLKEECGVLGVYTPGQDAAPVSFFGLFALQHRGQESAGIAVSDGSMVRMHKGMGLVNQVFSDETVANMPGEFAIGHTRYSTTGASVLRNAQPIFCQSLIGDIAVAHNGNLINAIELRKEMEEEGEIFDSTSDSELLARILVKNLPEGVEFAVREVMRRCKGAYSITVLTPRLLLGFRDPWGIRPLSAGRRGDGFMIASESCAFGPVGGKVERELHPGECVVIDKDGMRFFMGTDEPKHSMCLFEFIYFARPDSVMYGTPLYSARENMGRNLAKEHPVEADIVVPVPDSGIPAAHGFADESGIPYKEGMMKSRYIHRTFIQPDQSMRELGVRMKLTPLEEHIRGQRIVLVDDSIVRGTTTKQIVKLMFEAGAKEVHVRITAPPIKFPCFYGIDMASKGELAAAVMSIPDLCKYLGATSLGYLSIQGAVDAVGKGKDRFCLACFNGDYPIAVSQHQKKHAFDEPPDVGQLAGVASGQLRLIED
jgi:amidophosphoribosyltransferase